jgi:hypothetical protein
MRFSRSLRRVRSFLFYSRFKQPVLIFAFDEIAGDGFEAEGAAAVGIEGSEGFFD